MSIEPRINCNCRGRPFLEDLLADDLIGTIMRADDVEPSEIRRLFKVIASQSNWTDRQSSTGQNGLRSRR
jgi:hypothetical protein